MGCKLSITGNKSPVNQSCVPYPTKIRQKMKYAPPFPDKRGHDRAETDKKHENRRTGNHPARSTQTGSRVRTNREGVPECAFLRRKALDSDTPSRLFRQPGYQFSFFTSK